MQASVSSYFSSMVERLPKRELESAITLDRVTLIALFAIYPALPPGSRLIVSDHKISCHFPGMLPMGVYNKTIDFFHWTIGKRNECMHFNAVSDLKRYGQLLSQVVNAQVGIDAYDTAFGQSWITTQFLAGVKRRLESGDALTPSQNDPLLKTCRDTIFNAWGSEQITLIQAYIKLILERKRADQPRAAEISALLAYLDTRQDEIKPLLEEEQKLLKKIHSLPDKV